MRALFPVLSVLALICSCNNSDSVVASGSLVIRTSEPVYGLGDTVFVTATNVGSTPLVFGFCQGTIERLSGSSWHPAPENPEIMPPCRARNTTVGPGEAASTWNVVHEGLTSGIYRIRFDTGSIVSNAFRVQ